MAPHRFTSRPSLPLPRNLEILLAQRLALDRPVLLVGCLLDSLWGSAWGLWARSIYLGVLKHHHLRTSIFIYGSIRVWYDAFYLYHLSEIANAFVPIPFIIHILDISTTNCNICNTPSFLERMEGFHPKWTERFSKALLSSVFRRFCWTFIVFCSKRSSFAF
jgi:hypothetical protein